MADFKLDDIPRESLENSLEVLAKAVLKMGELPCSPDILMSPHTQDTQLYLQLRKFFNSLELAMEYAQQIGKCGEIVNE